MSRAKAAEYNGQRLPDRQAEALQTLYNAITAQVEADPHSIPCLTAQGHMWTNDHPKLRRAAARACQDCPLVAQCSTYATEHQEPAGTWGGESRGYAQHSAPLGGTQ